MYHSGKMAWEMRHYIYRTLLDARGVSHLPLFNSIGFLVNSYFIVSVESPEYNYLRCALIDQSISQSTFPFSNRLAVAYDFDHASTAFLVR